MAEVGTYYITIMPDMSKFTGSVKNAMGGLGEQSGQKYSSGFMSVLKGSALGTVLGNLATTAGSEIMSGLSNGIGRLDTIENFPRVMEALGYNAGEASESIQLIMQRLDGLPTATQDVVTLTQAIADSTGDLDLATQAALGFNDMMLANGASAGEVTQAQGVFNRVLGKGNATAAQWQSLQSVMPAQLAAVARELLGEGGSVEALRDKLNDGTISWNDFLQAIVRLDQEGSGSMASFEEQARANSDGIGTALANVQNRIGSGWASILQAIGKSNISGAIDSISYGVRGAMEKVAEGVKYVVDAVGKTSIVENVSTILGNIGDKISEIAGSETFREFADGFIALVDGALQWIVDHGAFVSSALAAVGAAIGFIAGFNLVIKVAEFLGLVAGVPGILQTIWTVLMANPFVAIAAAIAAVIAAIIWFFTETETGKQLWSDFCQFFVDAWNGLKEDFSNGIAAIKQNLEDNAVQWEKFKENIGKAIDAVKDFFGRLKDDFDNMVARIKQNLEDNAVQWDKFKQNVGNAIDAVKGFFGNLKDDFDGAVSRIKQNLEDNAVQWQKFKDNVSTTIENLRSGITEKFEAARTAVLGTFDGIRNGIKEKVDWAAEQVERGIEFIKGLFDFDWSLPAPRLPHIAWHWESVGGLLSIPEFDGIDWYAKGGVFNAASIIGVGEAGPEAALPLNDRTYGAIAAGIAEHMGGGRDVVVERLADTIIVRQEADIDLIADRLTARVRREMGATA